jgi:hypothetical protein
MSDDSNVLDSRNYLLGYSRQTATVGPKTRHSMVGYSNARLNEVEPSRQTFTQSSDSAYDAPPRVSSRIPNLQLLVADS